MKALKTFIKNHTLLSIYTMVFLILLYGIIETTGSKYVFNMFLFFIPLITFYFGLTYLAKNKKIKGFSSLKIIPDLLPNYSFLILTGICILLIIGHLIHIGGSPAVKGFSIMDTISIVELRRHITSDASSFWNYISSFNIKAILPFTLLLLTFKKKKIFFWILFFIGVFYAFSLMQKSYILTVLFPIIILLFFKKKYLQMFVLFITCGIVIVSLVYIQNPQMRGGINNVTNIDIPSDDRIEDDRPHFQKVLVGLKNRVLIVPGEMVSEWFDKIPNDKPFLNGDGYSFVCNINGHKYRNYATELYPVIRPNFSRRGLKGSVNAASFMYEYSNFGKFGLVLSAFLLALLFVIIEVIFAGNVLLKISLNLFPVFMMSSGALTTALFSGGWGLIIVLYFIFESDFKHRSIKNKSLPLN
ncbi:MAG: hypothetical protein QNK85_08715 [Crocinitomicaceae bacterium]